jgi:hypothetical protein
VSMHLTKLGSQVFLDPEVAARRLRKLYRRFDGRTVDVARYLEVCTSTVKRWVVILKNEGHDVRSTITEIRRRRRLGLDG